MSELRSFAASEAYLRRAEKVIPLGSQTFSKSRTQVPVGASPLFLKKASGAEVWDLDDNNYIDFTSALAAISLGYSDPDVNAAVHAQLDEGVILSLPHPLEAEVAELICDVVPCAEKVRFGKNGSDATSGAIRLARAYTGRDRVAVCGYHGWQDWYIGSTTRNRGVPQATRDLTSVFQFNDLPSLEQLASDHGDDLAAIILEPMNANWPAEGFLQGVRDLADRVGAVLIFDETITGFRFSIGGAQKLFGVTPDLATFGKGMANGFPVSAIAGRADLMKLMEEIFFSFTFGGELLSLAAARATIGKMLREPVLAAMEERGRSLAEKLETLIEDLALSEVFSVSGHPSWSFLKIANVSSENLNSVKTLILQELHQRGILALGQHYLTFAHTDDQVDALMRAYGETLPIVKDGLERNDFGDLLRVDPLVPLFKVR